MKRKMRTTGIKSMTRKMMRRTSTALTIAAMLMAANAFAGESASDQAAYVTEKATEEANKAANKAAAEVDTKAITESITESVTESVTEETGDADSFVAPDFTYVDQFGERHTLSDYQGKVVFLNFWGTWCPPCRSELGDIQALYEEYEDSEDVAVLGVAFPGQNGEGSEEEIAQFLEENGYTYPTVMADTQAAWDYQITAFPTTFMIDRAGDIFGYVPGAISLEIMEDIVQQTLAGSDEA